MHRERRAWATHAGRQSPGLAPLNRTPSAFSILVSSITFFRPTTPSGERPPATIPPSRRRVKGNEGAATARGTAPSRPGAGRSGQKSRAFRPASLTSLCALVRGKYKETNGEMEEAALAAPSAHSRRPGMGCVQATSRPNPPPPECCGQDLKAINRIGWASGGPRGPAGDDGEEARPSQAIWAPLGSGRARGP
jgi:hypothetical protein